MTKAIKLNQLGSRKIWKPGCYYSNLWPHVICIINKLICRKKYNWNQKLLSVVLQSASTTSTSSSFGQSIQEFDANNIETQDKIIVEDLELEQEQELDEELDALKPFVDEFIKEIKIVAKKANEIW